LVAMAGAPLEAVFGKLRRHVACGPLEEAVPELGPGGKLQEAWLAALQLERRRLGGFVLLYPRKSLSLGVAGEVLSWFGLRDGRDILVYPSASFPYPSWCDPRSNTALAYIAPVVDAGASPVAIEVPDRDYILSVGELVESIREVVRGRYARLFVLSKYARPGNVQAFISRLPARGVELYIASETARGAGWLEHGGNVKAIKTSSHRKLVLVVAYDGETGKPVLAGYRGSMNVFYPGVDDYLEAVNDWEDMKRLLHGVFRAFLIY